MALKQDRTEYPFDVTNNDKGRERGQESSSIQEINPRRKKRTLASTGSTEVQMEKRKREEEFENEEILLRDKLLDKIDSFDALHNSEGLISTTASSSSSGDVEENPNGETNFFQDRKIIKFKGKLPNLALPEGWLALNHRSGGIIYLHRSTRVCTWSRPYYLGKGSVRKHDVPIAAIPCLHQKKALETEANLNSLQKDSSKQLDQSQVSGSVLNFINTAGATPSDDNQTQIGFTGSHIGDNVSVSGGDGDGSGISVRNLTDSVKVDCNVSRGDGDVGDGTGGVSGSYKADSVIVVDHSVSADVRKGDSEVSAKGDGCFTGDNTMVVTKSKCPVFGENDGFGHGVGCDRVDGTTEPGCIASGYNYEVHDSGVGSGTIISCIDADRSDSAATVATHESGNSNKDEDLSHPINISNIFHPKDGLDVVNDTLSVRQSLQKTEIYFSKPLQREQFVSSSKLESSTVLGTALKDTACGINDSTTKQVTQIDSKKDNYEEKTTDEPSDRDSITLHQTGKLKPKDSKNTISAKTIDQKLEPKCVSTESNSGIELVDSEELTLYLEKLFDFEELTREQEQNVSMAMTDHSFEQEDSLPPLLDCLPYCVKGVNARQNKGWVLNPGGKTPIAILHEYSQAVLKEKPVYVCSECDNPSAPFMAEVQMDGITHGTGQASSKKQAKQAAAEATLQVFLPDVFKKIRDYQISPKELEYFDKLRIDHPNVYEVSIKSGLASPSQVLQECLKRNQGVCSQTINFKIIPGENKNEHTYSISCGKHTAQGLCKNKKTGKQLASQALLKKLHPHVSTWGSLLRIYCDRPSSVVKKYKTADDDVLMCKPQYSSGDPPRGEFLLARLKEEMKKIADNRKQDRKSRPQTRKDYTKDNPISTVDI